MNCGICGKNYRSGGGLVFDASLTQKRACQKCADKALRIMPSINTTACCCGQTASVCEACCQKREHASKVNRDIKNIAKGLRARATAYKSENQARLDKLGASFVNDFMDGKVEALEDAATFIETGKW
jgi:hypothetical protein